MQSRLIGMVFSNGRMLSASDKSDSINEHTQENNKIKLHILGVWQNDHEFIRQLVYQLHKMSCHCSVSM